MYLVTAEEMRAFDATAIEDYGIPGVVLMENAGRTTFHILRAFMDCDVQGLRVAVIAGPGNNGGDGYVIARYLINHGADVQTFLLSPPEKIKGDALINLEVLRKMTSEIYPVHDGDALEEASYLWDEADVIVDAILGTGLKSEVRSPYREAVEKINATGGLKLAVDLPSGLDADSGKILGTAVMAHLTATYGFRKLGMALHPGRYYCGQIEVVDISVPVDAIASNPPRAWLYQQPEVGHYLLARSDPEAHKGTFGRLLVVGGSPGKTGAPAMAAQAATRVGAGLVTVGIPASLNPILENRLVEEMTEPIPESIPGYLGETSTGRILSLAEGKQGMVLGPGLSTNGGVQELVQEILSSYHGWIVIDADGLNAIGQSLEMLGRSPADIVVTPHPGEMGRLTGRSTEEVQEDRVGLARQTATENGIWVILKGARTITASPDGYIYVNTTGNPWMASGGQGDALSGILGGLLVQGVPPEEALPFGVFLHGLAADNVVTRVGPAPVTATDVIAEISTVLGSFEPDREPT
jgi:ADP-dependent NAD(P)H-hydrate dehydratase / NAD(P)H-hydrate epimerase